MSNTSTITTEFRSTRLFVTEAQISDLSKLSDKLHLMGDLFLAIKHENLDLMAKSITGLCEFFFDASRTIDQICDAAHIDREVEHD